MQAPGISFSGAGCESCGLGARRLFSKVTEIMRLGMSFYGLVMELCGVIARSDIKNRIHIVSWCEDYFYIVSAMLWRMA